MADDVPMIGGVRSYIVYRNIIYYICTEIYTINVYQHSQALGYQESASISTREGILVII